MFCRFCGASIQSDSEYCSKCGKRLPSSPRPWVSNLVRTLRLESPYPYAAVLFIFFAAWVAQPRQSNVDYSQVRLELELEGESGRPDENIFRHHLSLVVENVSDAPIREIPVEFRVRIEPERTGEVVSDFLGRRLVIHRDGESLPLIVVLTDLIEAQQKRRYTIDGIVTMTPPADVIYEVLAEGTGEVLTSLEASIGREAPDVPGPVAGLRLLAPRVPFSTAAFDAGQEIEMGKQ